MNKIPIFVALLAAFSCHKESLPANTCQVRNPLTELKWLQDSIASYNRSYVGGELSVSQALYQGQSVFGINYSLGIDAGVGSLYRCDDSLICRSNVTIAGLKTDCGDIFTNQTSYTIIYKTTR